MSASTREGDSIARDPKPETRDSSLPPDDASYDARFGYREIDVLRYERRRYGSPVRRFNLRLVVRAIVSGLAGVPAGGLVLDAPCGTGILGESLRARGLEVIAADISPAMLDVAHARAIGRGWVRADLERPPFRPASFDAVVCNRFLMHLPSATRVAVLRAMASICRGPLVVTVCHPYTVKSGLRALRRFVGGRAKRSPRLTRAELDAEVAAAGLHLTRLIPVTPLLSEIWVAVLDHPNATGVPIAHSNATDV
jgi:SAM-dependent methyltransferase